MPNNSRLTLPSSSRYWALSLGLHTLILLSAYFLVDKPEAPKTQASRTDPIKIRIITSSPKESDAGVELLRKEESESRPAKQAKQLPIIQIKPRMKANQDKVKSGQVKIHGYDELFPKPGLDHMQSAFASKQTGEGEYPPDNKNFDPEGAVGFSEKTKDLAKLQVFAKELSGQISIPVALKRMQKAGQAQVRYTQLKDASWSVTEASGDPYFRALLFETMNNLSQSNYALISLSQSDLSTVRISLEYRTISTVDQTTPLVAWHVDGNKIFLTVNNQEDSDKWQMLAVDPSHKLALNVLGAGLVLLKPLIEDDPYKDVEIRRLRTSPAYRRPIGR